MNGVPAIHLNIDAPLSCDPIMGLEVSKWEVHTPEELSTALQEINSLRDKRKEEVISAAKNMLKIILQFLMIKTSWFFCER